MTEVAVQNDPEGFLQKCPRCGWGLNSEAMISAAFCPRCGCSLDPARASDSASAAPAPASPSDSREVPVEEVLFEQARDLEGQERSEYLDRACGENQRLRRRIEELLAAAEGVDSLLDLPETAGVTQVGDGPTAAGRLIGNYKRQRKRPRIAIPINRVFPRRFEAISIGSS